MRAASELFVDGFKGGRANANERFLVVPWHGFGEIPEPGSLAEFVQYCGFHSSVLLVPFVES